MQANSNDCAPAQGQAAPERPIGDEAPSVKAEGFRDQGTTEASECAAHAAIAEADKAFATLRAELALRGFELHIVADGADGSMFMVQRWSQSRMLASFDDVRAFANQVAADPC